METVVSAAAGAPWAGRRVLVTGHTGFKGSWLSLWLHHMGAKVTGFALPAPTQPSLFESARIAELVDHVEGDVRDADAGISCRLGELGHVHQLDARPGSEGQEVGVEPLARIVVAVVRCGAKIATIELAQPLEVPGP